MNDHIVNYFDLGAIDEWNMMNKTCFFFFLHDLGRATIKALLVEKERERENNVYLLSYLYINLINNK